MSRQLTRRRLLLGTVAVAGGGLALAWLRPDPRRARLTDDPSAFEPSAWLQLLPSGAVIVQVDRAEMGQGVMTAYVTLVAEELEVAPAQIEARLAPVHPLFQDPTQFTVGSRSMRSRVERLRKASAAARAMLVEAASRRLGVAAAELGTDGAGRVVHAASGRSLGYGELAAEAALLPVPKSPVLRERAAFRYIGQSVQRVDVPAKVTGQARFGLDVRLPGMLTALVARGHERGARLAGWDGARARTLPGVHAVVEIPTGVAVVAESFWHARRGIEALAITWTPGPIAGVSTASVHSEQRRLLGAEGGHRARGDGDVDAVLDKAGEVISAEYSFPYLAHATMEPMNCTVALSPGRAELWVPSQGPDFAREVACGLTGLPREAVTVHSTFCGGGFGRRALMDYVAEAVAVARQVDRPVKLAWTREDDIRHDWFRQATVHSTRAAPGADGLPQAWSHRLVAAPVGQQMLSLFVPTLLPGWVPQGAARAAGATAGRLLDRIAGPVQARDGSVGMPYAIPHVAVDIINWDPGVPIGIWRSVASSYTAFVVESFIDELAHAAGRDPADYRRALLANQPRHRAVLDAVLRKAGWGSPPPGRFQGLAVHATNGSVVGQVAEVSVSGGAIRVHRVSCVIDCGWAVNPDIVHQQMEGGIVFGLGAALYGEVRIENGRALESNFHDYRMLTLRDAPEVDVEIIETGAPVGGAGEPGTPPVAPAVANAVFAATGRRLRSLPLRL